MEHLTPFVFTHERANHPTTSLWANEAFTSRIFEYTPHEKNTSTEAYYIERLTVVDALHADD